MWVRYLKDFQSQKKNNVAWAEDDASAQVMIDDGILARCTGPEGISLEEDTPERVISQLAKEDGVSFGQKEAALHASADTHIAKAAAAADLKELNAKGGGK